MKSAVVRRARAAVLATVVAAGCASLQSMINRQAPGPAANARVLSPTPTPFETPPVARRRRSRHAPVRAREPAASPTPAVASIPVAPTPVPSVMLGGVAAGPDATQRLIDDAAKRLARVDEAKLAPPDAAAYDQARNMLESAMAAKRQGDDLTATGFAQKASALARSLRGPR